MQDKRAQAARQKRAGPGAKNPGEFAAMNNPTASAAAVPSVDLSSRKGSASTGKAKKSKSAEKIDAVMRQLCDRVVESLNSPEAKKDEWTPPWVSMRATMLPGNPTTGRMYGGINSFVLWAQQMDKAYPSASWGTYKQWSDAGCQVQKGEKGSTVFRPATKRCCDNKECSDGSICGGRKRVFWSANTVFNAAQVEGTPPPHPKEGEDDLLPRLGEDDVARATSAADSLLQRVGAQTVTSNRGIAAYSPTFDRIEMPPVQDFDSPEDYLSTLSHELVHWTGHESRVNRSVSTDKRSEDYAREELVAELGAVLLGAHLGIEHRPRKGGHSAYLTHWANQLGGSNGAKELKQAMSKAQTAVNYILEELDVSEALAA